MGFRLTIAMVASCCAFAAASYAAPVTATFDGLVVETHDQRFQTPPGIALGDPVSGSFSYDPDVAVVSRPNPFAAIYTFTSGASLTSSADGFTVGAHASAARPMTAIVTLDAFILRGGEPDPTNNLPFFIPSLPRESRPELSLMNLGNIFSDPFPLPTDNFRINVSDALLFWNVEPPPIADFVVRFQLHNLAFASRVPEPGTLGLLSVALLGLGVLRRAGRPQRPFR